MYTVYSLVYSLVYSSVRLTAVVNGCRIPDLERERGLMLEAVQESECVSLQEPGPRLS